MHYFTFAEKDTTIYQASASLNAGMDEILEVRKEVSDSGDSVNVSRILMRFDISYISSSIVSGTITNPKFYLNLFDAKSSNLNTSQSLYAYPISQSWDMGQGRSYDNPITTEGASWNYRDGLTNGTIWTSEISGSGGTWYTGSGYVASHSISHKTIDIRMDVTDIVNRWLDGDVPNDGFMVKRSGSVGNLDSSADEGSVTSFGQLAFFSSDTHTKYPPTLETVWDDSKWSEGSLSPLTQTNIEDMVVYMKGLRPEYKEKSKVKFRLVGRAKYPTKSYSNTASEYLTAKYLPSGSKENIGGDGAYYSVRDAQTEDVIIPFGSGSLISCDSTGNYFNLWMNGFQSERYYKFEFKVVSGSNTVDETIQYFDDDFTFKVVR